MKKYILLLFIALFSVNIGFSQGPPPPDGDTGSGEGGFCPCCEEDFIDPLTGDPYLNQDIAYDDCKEACRIGNNPCAVPIDASLLILLLAGASLGIYFVSKNNKKRQFEI
jgi:hypothetical protein